MLYNKGCFLKTAAIFVCLLFLCGCLTTRSAKKEEKPKVYVTPCTVAAEKVRIRVTSDGLSAQAIKPRLIMTFVDDFSSPAASGMHSSYTLSCYWGNNVGERRDFYYCKGQYRAPELDENNVITRFIWKSFKIGFSVDQNKVGTWVDSSGVKHQGGTVYYLTIETVEPTCWIAD